MTSTCCDFGCKASAEYRIEWGDTDDSSNPDNYTEACEAHVGGLLGHHPLSDHGKRFG
jgi:hypothetical protein